MSSDAGPVRALEAAEEDEVPPPGAEGRTPPAMGAPRGEDATPLAAFPPWRPVGEESGSGGRVDDEDAGDADDCGRCARGWAGDATAPEIILENLLGGGLAMGAGEPEKAPGAGAPPLPGPDTIVVENAIASAEEATAAARAAACGSAAALTTTAVPNPPGAGSTPPELASAGNRSCETGFAEDGASASSPDEAATGAATEGGDSTSITVDVPDLRRKRDEAPPGLRAEGRRPPAAVAARRKSVGYAPTAGEVGPSDALVSAPVVVAAGTGDCGPATVPPATAT
jgi:hypothetical protein